MKALNSARSSIIMHTYALTDEAVIETLLKKHHSSCTLNISTDAKTIPSIFKYLQQPLQWRRIKTSGLMHEKLLMIDDAVVFLGTANMTYESLSMHDNFIIGFYHPGLAHDLTEYTQAMDHIKNHKNLSHKLFTVDDQLLELWLLPYQGNAPLERLRTLIQNATQSLSVAMFTLTHPVLLQELIAAHERGVLVKVFLDATSAQGASARALKTLVDAHIPVYLSTGLPLLHHKLMLVDETIFVLGSANWTQAAFKKNYDFFVVLSPLHKLQIKALLQLFKTMHTSST